MKSEILEKYIQAGKIAAEVREESAKIAKIDMPLLELAVKIEAMVLERGAEIAFPVNLSLNEFAAHYTPQSNDETKIKSGDVFKIDVGTHIDGYIADTAITVDFGDNSKLLQASRDALNAAVDLVKPGVSIEKISAAIEEAIKSSGFLPIENLTGHGLDRYVEHTEPTIPNVGLRNNRTLEEDQVIAIEPFATNGAGHVKDTAEVMIFSFYEDKPVRSVDAKKLALYAGRFSGLPFAERWLLNKDAVAAGMPDSLFKIRLALRELVQRGVFYSYPVLRDAKGGLVSQAEHTIIVRDDPIIITK
ncbi:MAG TPA: type II methionyl aminopeptidase [archaeon]|nr:type II methionyl aminopeptidase [archaeon]